MVDYIKEKAIKTFLEDTEKEFYNFEIIVIEGKDDDVEYEYEKYGLFNFFTREVESFRFCPTKVKWEKSTHEFAHWIRFVRVDDYILDYWFYVYKEEGRNIIFFRF